MVASVVPITRLRRATTWWSYTLPPRMTCEVGSLVEIPFRGRTCLGVVWGLDVDNEKASEAVIRVVTRTPLVRQPHRRFIEWLSEAGFTSLSTALYVWLPSALRRQRLSRPAEKLLAEQASWQISAEESGKRAQYLFLVPGERPQTERALAHKFADTFATTFQSEGETGELAQWLAVARGEYVAVYGRERALFAPFLNLRQLVLQEPEDISYYHEQIPYLNLVEAAEVLAQIYVAEFQLRSHLPAGVAALLWSGREVVRPLLGTIRVTDLRQEPILGPELVQAVRSTLAAEKYVILLYNAHDRLVAREDGDGKKLLPGVESLRRQLAYLLNVPVLSARVLLGTRAELTRVPLDPTQVGLTAILSLDPLLRQSNFADQVHGWGDLAYLLRYPVPCWIQSYNQAHALMHALRNNQFSQYCMQRVEEQRRLGLPPFATTITCSIPEREGAEGEARRVAEQLQSFLVERSEWQVSSPFPAKRRRTETLNILVHGPQNARIPEQVRKTLAALPRPWKVQRNAWYVL